MGIVFKMSTKRAFKEADRENESRPPGLEILWLSARGNTRHV